MLQETYWTGSGSIIPKICTFISLTYCVYIKGTQSFQYQAVMPKNECLFIVV